MLHILKSHLIGDLRHMQVGVEQQALGVPQPAADDIVPQGLAGLRLEKLGQIIGVILKGGGQLLHGYLAPPVFFDP